MILYRTALASLLWVTTAAVSAQQPAEPAQTSTAQASPGAQLRKRPETKSKPAPPPPLTLPAAMEPAKAPNANPIYQALRQRSASGSSFLVKDLTLKRDAGEIHLIEGTVTLYNEVNGQVNGAAFSGHGVFHIEPPSAMERRQLKLMMKTEVLDQPFTTAVLAFTDDTAAELRHASAGDVQGVNAMGESQEMQTLFRKDLRYDLEERLLDDVLQSRKGGFFLANMKGSLFSKRLLYFVDPHGALEVAPEEVGLLTSNSEGAPDVTLGFRSEAQRKAVRPAENTLFGIKQQTIDIEIEKNGRLAAKATALVTANGNGVEVLPLSLYPRLRVTGVWGPKGEALDFIQEDKERDADFAVVLQKPLAKGESIEITTAYGGKDAVRELGNWNYEVNGGARESWYPNVSAEFGNYANYDLTFHTPKDVEVIATGSLARDTRDGKERVSEWHTTTPIPVAGFNLGGFKTQLSERNPDLQVSAYANVNASVHDEDEAASKQILGTMNTTGMLKQALSEGDAAVQIYTDYFGPLDFDHVALTQQSACNYGQSWPMLVYLPICYFWDSTIQHQLGVLDSDPTYWKVVTAHEVAHQWWGSTVGFNSYRDQWMSEGFADWSASLFLMRTHKEMQPYRDFWALERKRLLEKNEFGMRAVDVGPVVMGSRASSSRAGGDVYQSLIYPKGAYIVHMLEMQFWSAKYQDAPFKAAMHDFVNTYRGRAATTEDFKTSMEKNMPPWMDVEHNHRLDWFFNAFVYGIEVPSYTVTGTFEKKGDDTSVHMKLSQTGVGEDFLMLVPVYIEFEDKNIVLIGHAPIKGPHDTEATINLGRLPGTPKRLLVNYYYDILSAN